MKHIIIMALNALLFLGCTEETPQQNENSIYGTWQLVEIIEIGASEPNQAVINGYTFTLKTSGQAITTDQELGCAMEYNQLEGNFLLEEIESEDAVIFEFYCPQSNEKIDGLEFYYSFKDNLLVLNTINRCWGKCFYRFKKIADGDM